MTPDSFSDGGRYSSVEGAVEQAMDMVRNGAAIIDVGGESTRPYSEIIPVEKEIQRVVPVIQKLRARMIELDLDALISIDTRKPDVAKEAVEAGAEIINDVNALRTAGKVEMADVAVEFGVPVVLMHMLETPQTMQVDPVYDDVVGEIMAFLNKRAECAIEAGIKKNRIIIDPGIGFGKTLEHNLTIMNHLDKFRSMGYPVLIGTSNKSIVGKVLDLPVDDRLEGTLATVAVSVMKGASIIRVHDVRAAKRVVDMTEAILAVD